MKKVLGIGNALTDILLQIEDDDILNQLKLPKGSMQLVNKEKQSEISNYIGNLKQKKVAGGSASNTINGIAQLGGRSGFIGKVGRDEIGSFYTTDLSENGVKPYLLKSDQLSGRCLVLISADGERTMCTYLGAAAELAPDDIQKETFIGYDIFHIEGYLVQNHNLLRRAMATAKEAGLLISLDMASFNIVEENLSFLKEMVRDYVDILFANEEEAKSFTGEEPIEALNQIAELVSVAIVKVGKNGSYIRKGDEMYHVSALSSDCLDSTGAGDLYASGFLYGLAHNYPLNVCGEIGSLVAGNIIEVIGAKIRPSQWENIHVELKNIVEACQYVNG